MAPQSPHTAPCHGGDSPTMKGNLLLLSHCPWQTVPEISSSHPQSAPSSKHMAAVQSRETDLQLQDLWPLSWSGVAAPLPILSRDCWGVAQGDPMDTESDHQREEPFTPSTTMEQPSQSLEQEGEVALSDWLTDSEEDDSESVDWSSSDEDDLNDGSEANDLWNSFFNHDPYNPMNFSASIGPQSVAQNKTPAEKDDDSSQPETEDSENDKQRGSHFQSTAVNPLDFSVHTVTDRTTDKGRKDSVRSTELEVAIAVKPTLKHYTSEDYSTPAVKPGAGQSDGKTHKKVRFSPVVTVHPMIAWAFAYRAARQGPWEQYARDRSRFQRRIAEAERVIAPCLEHNHWNAIRTKLAAV